jgi:hypothetical protein
MAGNVATWNVGRYLDEVEVLPFLESEGKYWGDPSDDDSAIEELTRMRSPGADFIVFAAPVLWWLEHYERFHQHLRSTFSCVLQNEGLVVFDLR